MTRPDVYDSLSAVISNPLCYSAATNTNNYNVSLLHWCASEQFLIPSPVLCRPGLTRAPGAGARRLCVVVLYFKCTYSCKEFFFIAYTEFLFNATAHDFPISPLTLYIIVDLARKLPKDSPINQFKYYYTRKCLEHKKKEAPSRPPSAQAGCLS